MTYSLDKPCTTIAHRAGAVHKVSLAQQAVGSLPGRIVVITEGAQGALQGLAQIRATSPWECAQQAGRCFKAV